MAKKLKHISVSAAPFIKEFSKSLNKASLTHFMHDLTFGNGQISMLVPHEGIFLYYYKNKIPMLCTDDQGRTLEPGIYLNKILQEQYKDCAILMPLMVKVTERLNINLGKNSLHIIEQEENCQHFYSLFFDLLEKDFLHWVINNGNLINDLIARYNLIASDFINEAKQPENRIILPNSASNFNHIKPQQIRVIHKEMHKPIYLSVQQSRCLTYLMQGKSAKEIAACMSLSQRTVEHYLENTRRLLGCANNKELIAFYGDQIISK